MTYRELLAKLSTLTNEQLDTDITVADVDKGHPYFIFYQYNG